MTFIAGAALLGSARAETLSEAIDQLKRIELSGEQLTGQIVEVLKHNLRYQPTGQESLLSVLQWIVDHPSTTYLSAQPGAITSEVDARLRVDALFAANAEEVAELRSAKLKAELAELIRAYAVFKTAEYYADPRNAARLSQSQSDSQTTTTISIKDMPLVDYLLEKFRSTLIEVEKQQELLLKTTSTITKLAESTLKLNDLSTDALTDLSDFQKQPVQILARSAQSLVDSVNAGEARGPQADLLNDRIMEYVKAIQLIGRHSAARGGPIEAQDSWVAPVNALIVKLRELLLAEGDQSSDTFKWNALLMRKLLQFLAANADKDAAVKHIKEFFVEARGGQAFESSPAMENFLHNDVLPNLPPFTFDSTADAEKANKEKLLLVDLLFGLYTPKGSSKPNMLPEAYVDQSIDKFEYLASARDGTKGEHLFPTLMNIAPVNPYVHSDLFVPLHDSVLSFRNEQPEAASSEKPWARFDTHVDTYIHKNPTSALKKSIVPLKLAIATNLLNKENHEMHFPELSEEEVQQLKEEINKPELASVKNILIGLYFLNNGNAISRKDYDNQAYVPAISGSTINTNGIDALRAESYPITEEPIPEPVQEPLQDPFVIEDPTDEQPVVEETTEETVEEPLQHPFVIEDPVQEPVAEDSVHKSFNELVYEPATHFDQLFNDNIEGQDVPTSPHKTISIDTGVPTEEPNHKDVKDFKSIESLEKSLRLPKGFPTYADEPVTDYEIYGTTRTEKNTPTEDQEEFSEEEQTTSEDEEEVEPVVSEDEEPIYPQDVNISFEGESDEPVVPDQQDIDQVDTQKDINDHVEPEEQETTKVEPTEETEEHQVVDVSSSDINKIQPVEQKDNLVHDVTGNLQEQIRDMLKKPDFASKLNQKIMFRDADGSLTEVILVRVVRSGSACREQQSNLAY